MTARRRRTGAALAIAATLAACGGGESVGTDLLHAPALQRVVQLQEARDAEGLVRLLDDGDPAVRARAAFALGSVQDVRAAVDLTRLLADDFASVRAEAAFALGQIAPVSRPAETALLDLLSQDRDPAVRASVIEALGKAGTRASSEPLSEISAGAPSGADATLALSRLMARGEIVPEGTDTLIARLAHPDSAVRENAAWGIANTLDLGLWRGRAPDVAAALDALAKHDPAAANLLRALAKLADPGARKRIASWLAESPDWRNRAAAAESLAGGPSPADRAPLLTALSDSSAQVRVAAASALAASPLDRADLDKIGAWIRSHSDDRHTPGVLMAALAAGGRASVVLDWIRGLAPDDVAQRRKALEAAALLPDAVGVPLLAEAAGSPARALSAEAVRALAVKWAQDGSADVGLRRAYYDAFVKALAAKDPVTEPLVRALLADTVFTRMGSAAVVSASGPESDAPPSPVPALDWAALSQLGARPRLVLETPRGPIVIEMYADEAPLTVQTVAKLAREGRYDGVPFHRVVANFMAQGGDVDRGDGMGDPGFHLPSELTHLRYERGTAGMARTDKDTESSQFFLTHSMQPHLDGSYGAFGRVVEGQEAVDALLEGDVVTKARIEVGAATP